MKGRKTKKLPLALSGEQESLVIAKDDGFGGLHRRLSVEGGARFVPAAGRGRAPGCFLPERLWSRRAPCVQPTAYGQTFFPFTIENEVPLVIPEARAHPVCRNVPTVNRREPLAVDSWRFRVASIWRVSSPRRSSCAWQPSTLAVPEPDCFISTACERGDSNPYTLRCQILSLNLLGEDVRRRSTRTGRDSLQTAASASRLRPKVRHGVFA